MITNIVFSKFNSSDDQIVKIKCLKLTDKYWIMPSDYIIELNLKSGIRVELDLKTKTYTIFEEDTEKPKTIEEKMASESSDKNTNLYYMQLQ